MECVADTDWTGVLIIVLVLGFFLVSTIIYQYRCASDSQPESSQFAAWLQILIPVVKYMQVVGAYNKDKAAGCVSPTHPLVAY